MQTRFRRRESWTMRAVVFFIVLSAATTDGLPTNVWQDADDDWFNDANWSLGHHPVDGEAVLIASAALGVRLTNATATLASFELASAITLTVEGWNSALTATRMTIAGVLTHAINDVASTNAIGEWVPQHRLLLDGSNITIAATGMLDADWKGYRRIQGPGTPNNAGGGPGHAGIGGHGGASPPGPAYGEPDEPWQPGSGGGSNANGAEGGGAIRVIATGALSVHGIIRANGRNSLGNHGSGGSGGSIWIDCRTLAGSATGLVQAKGGNGIYHGGGAGAGRIAIHYDPDSQAREPIPAIRFDGTPGAQSQYSETFRAAMASLYLPDTRFIESDLTAQRFQWVQLQIPGWTVWEADTLTFDDCIVGLPQGAGLNVTNHLVLTNHAALHVFAAPVADVLTEPGATVTVGGDLRLHAGCWLLPYAHPTNGATVAVTVGGDLYVAADAGFDAALRGYSRGFGPGLEGTTYTSYSGAGHGGISGMAFGGSRWGNAYGNVQHPVQAGSAGASLTLGGRGGGAIRLAVGGRAELHGTLTAAGGAGVSTHGGAGSGGSILLECETLTGSNSALLTADGGLGNYYGASGGGGRIAVHYDPLKQAALPLPVPPIRFSALAWPYTSYQQTRYMINAQEGTLWLPDTLLLTETLDQQRFRNLRLVIDGFTAWSPTSLTLDGCILTLPEGFVLDVANDLTLVNDAALTVYAAPTNLPGQRYGAEIRVGRDLTIGTNAWIFPQAHTSNAAIVGIKVGRHATIAVGGGIDAWGRGWLGQSGNTQGSGAGQHAYGGGGHGGMGGGDSGRGGASYGIPEMPLLPGSPAGWNNWGGGAGLGGPGGGAIHLRAGGHLRVDGLLTADGWNGSYYQGGGGSGGAIFLAAHRFSGTGEIRAKGGIAAGDVASGGGGRIAIWHGLSLDMIEARLESHSIDGLLRHYPYARFGGVIDVGWYGNSTHGLPEEGSHWFTTIRGTLLLFR